MTKITDTYRKLRPLIIDDIRSIALAMGGSGGASAGGGVTDHGQLTGLTPDDDHPQYLTVARADARYALASALAAAGAGLTYADGAYNVGAGAGIQVNADDVALASSVAGAGIAYAAGVLNIGAGAGIQVNTNDVALATGVAGDGLAWQSSGVLKVGAGDGLTVGADSVALTTPGTLSVSSSNAASGSHTHAVTSSSNPGAAASLLASDANGKARLRDFEVGTQGATTPAVTISGADNVAAGPDIAFSGNGLIAAPTSLYVAIDSDNSGTDAAFVIGNNAAHSGFTELMRLTEAGRLGIGNNAPSYELDVTGSLRTTTKVQTPLIDTAAGNISITPVGDIVLDPGGNDVLPGGSIEDDLGDYNRKWRTLFASELYVETLVAQDVLSTIGGRIEVTPTTTLIADLDNLASTMDVKHNNLRNGEYAYLMTAPNGTARFEAIKVTSSASAITGGYRYSITRNLDGTGANDFYAGDAVASLGKSAGEGHISLTATSTVYNHLGPTIVIYSRNSTSAWNAMTPTTAMGNLESFVGYGTPTQGFAVGNDLTKEPTTGFKGLTADATNGVRLFSTALSTYDGSTPTGYWGPDGNSFWIGPSASDKRVSWDGTILALNGTLRVSGSGTPTAGVSGLYATGGKIGYYNGTDWKMWMGSTGYFYFGGSSGARLQWNGSKLSGYSATDEQWYADASDGRFKFGAGNAAIDNLGLALKISYGWSDVPSSLIAWYTDPLDRAAGYKAKITAGTNATNEGGIYIETNTGALYEDIWYARGGTTYRMLHTGNSATYGDAAYLGGYAAATYGRLSVANTWTDTQAIEKSGSAIVRLNNTAAANTANLSAVDFYANTDAQLRQSGRIQATFPTITDASRKSSLSFFAANAGSLSVRMTLYGANLGIGNTTPSYALDVTGDARITTGNLQSANVFQLLNGTAAQSLYAGGLLASDDYADATNIPTNGIYSKGNIVTAGALGVYGISGFASAMYMTRVTSTPAAPSAGTQAGMFVWCPDPNANPQAHYFVISYQRTGTPNTMRYYYFNLREATNGFTWSEAASLPAS